MENSLFVVLAQTGDGPELWKANLQSFEEAEVAAKEAAKETGMFFWVEVERENPLHNLPDCDPVWK